MRYVERILGHILSLTYQYWIILNVTPCLEKYSTSQLSTPPTIHISMRLNGAIELRLYNIDAALSGLWGTDEAISGCVLLTYTQSCQGPQCLRPMGILTR